MRFVFLTLGYTPDLDGGAFRYATEVAERLAARGHEVHAVYPNPSKHLPERDERAGVVLHRVGRGAGGFISRWRAALSSAQAVVEGLLASPRPPTLLFSHHAYLAGALKPWPHVAFLHGPWALEHRYALQARTRSWPRRVLDAGVLRIMHQVEDRSLHRTQRLLVASEYSRQGLTRWHPGLSVPVDVVGGGANFSRFHPRTDREVLRLERGLQDGDVLFLAVRRLDPRMGLDRLLDAFAQVASRHPRARLWIAGKGEQRAALERQITASGMGQQVRLLGFVSEDELPCLYAAADAVLMPSVDLEGFGLATAEALACGTPVLASRAGANPELVAPLDPQLLFEPEGTASLSSLLDRVLNGALILPDRGRCAAHARTAFSWDRPTDAVESVGARHAVVV